MIELVKEASRRLRGVLSPTPIVHSTSLSRIFGVELFLKLENLQKTGSFKVRGAYNRIASLPDDERARGVITASTGNHAQAVAWAARLLGVKSLVVMPEDVPIVKHVAARGYGAEIVFSGKTFDESFRYALELSAERGMTFIHPFDDRLVMAGQGTIGLEILEEMPDVDTVVVPVGGGGLISGIAGALKESGARIKVIGVEAGASSTCIESLKEGRPVDVSLRPTIADGIAIKRVGERTLPMIKKYVDGVVAVSEDAIAASILMLLERKKLIVEGAGAVPLASVMEGKLPEDAGKTVLVLSGGNIDVTTLDRVIRKGLLKEGRVVRFSTLLTDRPGSLARFASLIAGLRSNILQIIHRRDAVDVPLGSAMIEVVLEVEGPGHSKRVFERLKREGYEIYE